MKEFRFRGSAVWGLSVKEFRFRGVGVGGLG